MIYKNYTKKAVILLDRETGEKILDLPELKGKRAPYCNVENIHYKLKDGTPVQFTMYKDSFNLPEKEDGVMYIVENIVRRSCPDRLDFISIGEYEKKLTNRYQYACYNFRVNSLGIK